MFALLTKCCVMCLADPDAPMLCNEDIYSLLSRCVSNLIPHNMPTYLLLKCSPCPLDVRLLEKSQHEMTPLYHERFNGRRILTKTTDTEFQSLFTCIYLQKCFVKMSLQSSEQNCICPYLF